MDELQAVGRRPTGKIATLDERYNEPAQRSVPRNAGPQNAPADYEDIEGGIGESGNVALQEVTFDKYDVNAMLTIGFNPVQVACLASKSPSVDN